MCVTRNRIREKLETLLSFFLSFITITKTGAGLFDRIHQKSEHTELPIIGWPSVSAGRREMRSGRGGRRRGRREREKMLKRGQKGRKKKMREGVTAMTSQKTRWERKRGIYADFQHLIKVIFFEEDRSSSAPQDIRLQTNLHWLAVNGCMIETMMKFMIRAGEKDWEEKKKKKAIICVLRWCRGMKGKV